MKDDTQLALIEADSDVALLMPDAERRRRYTARQVEKQQEKIDCILTMLAWGVPLKAIEAAAHVNHHTITTLAGRYAERLGETAAGLADYAQRLSAKCAYVAAGKVEEASGKDAAIMHGIFRDTAINLRLTAGQGDLDPAIEVSAVNERVEAVRAKLKALAAENAPAQLPAPAVELPPASPD